MPSRRTRTRPSSPPLADGRRQLRRRQPHRVASPPSTAGAVPDGPRLLQPGEAARPTYVRVGGPRCSPLRRRLAARGAQGPQRGRSWHRRRVSDWSRRAKGSDWPLSRKYGCLRSARPSRSSASTAGLGLRPGRRQLPRRLTTARPGRLAQSDRRCPPTVFDTLRPRRARNPGCSTSVAGSPLVTRARIPPLAGLARSSRDQLAPPVRGRNQPVDHRGAGPRPWSSDAGALVTTVVGSGHRAGRHTMGLSRRRGLHGAGRDAGRGDPLPHRGPAPTAAPPARAFLAGPTCDSADVLYQVTPVSLPLALAEGDIVRLESAGAYTSCYSTVGFNGFDPLPVVVA